MITRKPNTTSDGLDEFIKGAKDEQTKVVNSHEQSKRVVSDDKFENNKPKRATYYITPVYIEAIEQMAFYEKMDKSEIVREALKQYIPSKYLNLAVKR